MKLEIQGICKSYKDKQAEVQKNIKLGTSVTVYGTHEAWGVHPEYWGEYTTVYD